jgi:hypothetical protein
MAAGMSAADARTVCDVVARHGHDTTLLSMRVGEPVHDAAAFCAVKGSLVQIN